MKEKYVMIYADFSENYQILLHCPCAVVAHIQPTII